MPISLSTPTILVNNVPVAIKPNSFSWDEGDGDKNIRIASVGGGSIQTFTGEDVETKMSNPKFTMFTSPENLALLKNWRAPGSSNVIQATAPGFSRTFSNAVLLTKTPITTGVEGEMEVEFQSDPAV